MKDPGTKTGVWSCLTCDGKKLSLGVCAARLCLELARRAQESFMEELWHPTTEVPALATQRWGHWRRSS